MTANEPRHYGEWALSSWYDILPGPDRLLEVSTSLNEDDAGQMVQNWCAKLLTPGMGTEKLQQITESLIYHHWHQAKRMGCLGVQFTYINGFYHRFIWRASWQNKPVFKFGEPCVANVSTINWFLARFKLASQETSGIFQCFRFHSKSVLFVNRRNTSMNLHMNGGVFFNLL